MKGEKRRKDNRRQIRKQKSFSNSKIQRPEKQITVNTNHPSKRKQKLFETKQSIKQNKKGKRRKARTHRPNKKDQRFNNSSE